MRWVLLVLLSASSLLWAAGTPISKEYQIKAVFLFNFAQFVQWPAHTFACEDEPFGIGVLGDDPFGSFLDENVQGEKVGGHPIVVRRYSRLEDIHSAQILYVSNSESKRLTKILAALKGKNVLTVSDIENFARSGGMIRFVMEGGKIHFRINMGSAKNAHLKISSKLLRLAEIAGTERN